MADEETFDILLVPKATVDQLLGKYPETAERMASRFPRQAASGAKIAAVLTRRYAGLLGVDNPDDRKKKQGFPAPGRFLDYSVGVGDAKGYYLVTVDRGYKRGLRIMDSQEGPVGGPRYEWTPYEDGTLAGRAIDYALHEPEPEAPPLRRAGDGNPVAMIPRAFGSMLAESQRQAGVRQEITEAVEPADVADGPDDRAPIEDDADDGPDDESAS